MKLRIPVALLLAGFSAACADLPNAPSSPAFEPVLAVSDPPPPPADGSPIFEGCVPEPDPCPPPLIQIEGLEVKYFGAPGSNVAFVTFSSTYSTVVVSPGARVRDLGKGVIGQGTIKALTTVGDVLVEIIVDLSTATGSLNHTPPPHRIFQFQAEARFAATGLPVDIPVLFWYEF